MNSYRHFTNKDCEYYPCKNVKELNCLFCFCPLYSFDCGGEYIILDNGWKDCSKCSLPHGEEGYGYIINHLKKKEKKNG